MKKLPFVLVFGTLAALISISLSSCAIHEFRPTFYTDHGVAVVLERGIDLTKEDIDNAVFFYCKELPKCAPYELQENDLLELMSYLVVRFQWDHMQHPACEHGCAGLQQYNMIKVRWTGKISNCSFFHELNHVVEHFILREIDYDHSETDWWNCVKQLKEKYKEHE